jgi:predicted CoA-substrate-specific enzyme activase
MKALGIDIGSLTTKVVILEGDVVLASSVSPSGDEPEPSAKAVLEQTLVKIGLSLDSDSYIVSTGIGGKLVSFSQQQKAITTCLARGIHRLFPTARMGIDMGAETANVLKITDRGRISDWVSHDKCAAGTGVFLQQMAKLMQMPLEEMARTSLNAHSGPEISSTCAVFAESEVISHVHRDPPTPKDEIVAGIYSSVVSRLMTLCKRIGTEEDVAVAGGVALNAGLIHVLERELGFGVLVPEAPQLAAALGAAIIAQENIEKGPGG